MFTKVLIANRGAIAVRIIRTLKKMGITAIAIYHEQDFASLHVQQADIAVSLGNGSVGDTYLNKQKILSIAKEQGAEAIHPGYGFLSENTEFVTQCEGMNIAFIGPTTDQITAFGLKHEALQLAQQHHVPCIPGSPLLNDLNDALKWAAQTGYPVMLKSTAGGGGIGMQVCDSETVLKNAWDSVKRLGTNYFANDDVFLEKYIRNARHIEVQIFGDGQGKVIHLGERDCSAQRRNQKVIEETPAPNLSDDIRQALWQTSLKLMSAVNYRNAGTVEYIFDADSQQFYFLEVNTRLQVEHGVTEEVWGVDLVEWMVRLAADELADLDELRHNLKPNGHAIQARIYAESPLNNFLPSGGLLSSVFFSPVEKARVDTWVESGIEVPTLFDPMIGKVICHDPTRSGALNKLAKTLEFSQLYGIESNLQYLQTICYHELCAQGKLLTRSLAEIPFNSASFRVISGGTQTTVQDYPARQDYWHVGIPPSGPMDSVALRQANYCVGNNSQQTAALEITLNGPTLKFYSDCTIAVTGAELPVICDGQHLAMYQAHTISGGSTLALGKISGAGARAYLAVSGGIDCPEYLHSRSTFTLGQFGGHNGRALLAGDLIHLGSPDYSRSPPESINAFPLLSDTVQLRVIYGPHGAPEFFTLEDIEEFFAATWEVHYNSSRTGIRLIGPKPIWARSSGGEAGLHPSNIHDNAYAFGAVDFTGDMPVILGPDGPSLGGFVCPVTVIHADHWKLGQLKAGDNVQFLSIAYEDAIRIEKHQNLALEKGDFVTDKLQKIATPDLPSPIIGKYSFQQEELIVRLQGDHFVLLELGEMSLDIERRFKIHALMIWLEEHRLDGMAELTPGIRSIQIHYNPHQLPLNLLLSHIAHAAQTLNGDLPTKIPSRIVRLPLSWDDEACKLAIQKYQQSVRPNAPWCPSNIDFIRRINGLTSLDDVKDIVFSASYLVMGLGDVYLGAPVATPVNPLHRLVTTKYNPARTWTAENSVGIGGAYLCVYGMEGPGGYQFIGRTLQMWNRYRQTEVFEKPWLLRFFDQIQFVEVFAEELQDIRRQFPLGQYPIEIIETEFDLLNYRQLISENSNVIASFMKRRDQAFDEELADWKAKGQLTFEAEENNQGGADIEAAPDHCTVIESPASGNVWKIEKAAGDSIKAGDVIAIIESMKMEIEVQAPFDGKILRCLKSEGQGIANGQILFWLEPAV